MIDLAPEQLASVVRLLKTQVPECEVNDDVGKGLGHEVSTLQGFDGL